MYKKIISIILAAGLIAHLAACSKAPDEPAPATSGSASALVPGSSAVVFPESDTEYADYVGYQFAGPDPWDGSLAITVRSIINGKMEWTFTDLFEESTLYAEVTDTVVSDGVATFDVTGTSIEDENMKFQYQGTIEFKDGSLLVTFESGFILVENPLGGFSARIADALSGSGLSNQVQLNKTVDPS